MRETARRSSSGAEPHSRSFLLYKGRWLWMFTRICPNTVQRQRYERDGTPPLWSLPMRHLLRVGAKRYVSHLATKIRRPLVRLCEKHCTLTILVMRVLRFLQPSNWEFPSPAIWRCVVGCFPTFQSNIMPSFSKVNQPKKAADFTRSQQLQRSQKALAINAFCQFQNKQSSVSAIITTLIHNASSLSPT